MIQTRLHPELVNAIFAKVAFKPNETERYQIAAVVTGLKLYPLEVAADDIPPDYKPPDNTTAGCAWALLKSDGARVFERVGRRASTDPKRKAAWVNTYRVRPAMARAWLKAHGIEPPASETPLFEVSALK